MLIRGPFGRHAWTMQLRHLPRSKSGTTYHAPNPGRPVPMNDMPMRQEVDQKNFPDGVDRIPTCVADFSIPTLDSIIQKIGSDSTKQLFQLMESQTVYEKLAWAETESSVDSLSHAQEAVPPSVCHDFQAARLFLSHFGFLSLDDSMGKKPVDTPTISPLLTVLDTNRDGFSNDLYLLDKMSSRTCDTIHTFYVKVGQTTESDIIGNMSDGNLNSLDPNFWNMLLSLGWPVNVEEHSGWTGFLSTSWKINNGEVPVEGQTLGIDDMKFNGEKRILYWADVGSEIAFVVPTKWNKSELDMNDGNCSSASGGSETQPPSYERSISEYPDAKPIPVLTKVPIGQKPRTLSLDFEKTQSSTQSSSKSADPIPPTRRRTGASKPLLLGQSSAKILLVWLESFEDYLTFPIGN